MVCQVAKDYEEDRKAMVKGIFEEVTFGTDEDMAEESAEVLAELNYVKYFHFFCNIRDVWSNLS